MKKKLIAVCFIITLMFILVDCRSKSAEIVDEKIENDKLVVVVEKPKIVYVEKEDETKLSEDDAILIAKIVHAEASNQDIIGKRLVVDVVLNRVDNDKYPNNVFGVGLQEGQFVVSYTYTDEDLEAVKAELRERLDHNIIYFRTKRYHDFGTPCYQHGAHYFSKE